jgi:hypothetical protein
MSVPTRNRGSLSVEENALKMMQTDTLPWYREPWPWLLMAGPAAVVVAGFATLWIAVTSSDGLVTDDYYKQGLAINQTLQREANATQHGFRAGAQFSDDGRRISLRLDAAPGTTLPATLRMQIVHPTRAGRDGLVMLRQTAPGSYEGVGPVLTQGRWMLVLQDQQSTWRLDGAMVVPYQGSVILSPASSR